MENQITAQNARDIRARLIVEGANGPTTPDAHRLLDARGVCIVPDILVERAQFTAYEDPEQIIEADLSGHLGNGNGESEARESRASSARASTELLTSDNQLYEALTLLKGINILGLRDKAAG